MEEKKVDFLQQIEFLKADTNTQKRNIGKGEKKEEPRFGRTLGEAHKNGKWAIAAKTVQVRFWLLLVFLPIFDFSIWSFLNIQYIVDWCGRKGPQIVLLRLVAYLFALF